MCDFGTSKNTINTSLNTNAKGGTINWTAPEVLLLDDNGEYVQSANSQSDVWSFGMVLFELFSRTVTKI